MLKRGFVVSYGTLGLILLALSGCYRYEPPYNSFKPYNRVYVTTPPGALIGTAALAVTGGPILWGTAIGSTIGAGVGLYKDSRPLIIRQLQRRQIQFVQYGDSATLIVPTDRYFMFNSANFNMRCYSGLALLIKLIKSYPKCCPIYVAAFTNDIGSRYHKRMLTQAQAEAMVTFLWANGIPAQRLNAEGYADKNPVSDNKLIHGSAQNRRLEIQVLYGCSSTSVIPFLPMK